jgi:hypothetical protein
VAGAVAALVILALGLALRRSRGSALSALLRACLLFALAAALVSFFVGFSGSFPLQVLVASSIAFGFAWSVPEATARARWAIAASLLSLLAIGLYGYGIRSGAFHGNMDLHNRLTSAILTSKAKEIARSGESLHSSLVAGKPALVKRASRGWHTVVSGLYPVTETAAYAHVQERQGLKVVWFEDASGRRISAVASWSAGLDNGG